VVEIPLRAEAGRNFEDPPWCYLLWGAPAALIVATDAAYQASSLSSVSAGLLWAVAVAWIGVGCFINGRSCGRVHCIIDGVAMPILGLAAALNALSVVSFSWSAFWIVFFVVLGGSFVPEFVWGRYRARLREGA
jgi:hypothetical protein